MCQHSVVCMEPCLIKGTIFNYPQCLKHLQVMLVCCHLNLPSYFDHQYHSLNRSNVSSQQTILLRKLLCHSLLLNHGKKASFLTTANIVRAFTEQKLIWLPCHEGSDLSVSSEVHGLICTARVKADM